MFKNEQRYLDLLQDILDNGVESGDRTGVGTRRVFGRQMRFDLTQDFPLLTTKAMAWKRIVSELLWFVEGSGDERRLAEIHYGKPRSELIGKNTIWTENAHSSYWKPNAEFEGDLGRVYGQQWRQWRTVDVTKDPAGVLNDRIDMVSLDQLSLLIDEIKKNPNSRRLVLTAWNPGELSQMALPPCHMMCQFIVINGELSCLMTQRSGDFFLGVPFNIASYSLLTMMIAQVCGLRPKEFILSLGDAHIYSFHLDQVKEQLNRKPMRGPQVKLNTGITDINDFEMEDFQLIGYNSHPAIKAPMAV